MSGELEQARFIADIMCSRRAKKEKRILSEKYWNTDEWKKIYQEQVVAALALLKRYDYQDILSAVNNREATWCYSIRSKKITDILQLISARKAKLKKVKEVLKKETIITEQPNDNYVPEIVEEKQKSFRSRLD